MSIVWLCEEQRELANDTAVVIGEWGELWVG